MKVHSDSYWYYDTNMRLFSTGSCVTHQVFSWCCDLESSRNCTRGVLSRECWSLGLYPWVARPSSWPHLLFPFLCFLSTMVWAALLCYHLPAMEELRWTRLPLKLFLLDILVTGFCKAPMFTDRIHLHWEAIDFSLLVGISLMRKY